MNKIVVVALIIISSFCLSSCTKTGSGDTSKTLNVAYINTDSLLKKWEKYRDLGDKYIKDRNDLATKVKNLRKEISSNDAEITDSQKKELANLQNKHQALTTEWSKKRTEIVDEIRAIASEVAKEQHFDIVINNSESSPVIEYGGEDITVDILSKLREKEDKKNKK